jgi:hypothetical protein
MAVILQKYGVKTGLFFTVSYQLDLCVVRANHNVEALETIGSDTYSSVPRQAPTVIFFNGRLPSATIVWDQSIGFDKSSGRGMSLFINEIGSRDLTLIT